VDTDRLNPQVAWPAFLVSPRQPRAAARPCRQWQQHLSGRFFGCYVVAEYRLVSANIVRCHFLMNSTRETSKSPTTQPQDPHPTNLPTGKRHKVAVWTPQLTGAFLDFVQNDDLAVCWRLIALRGLRRGEALGLAWPDVDFERGTITIRRARVVAGTQVIWGTPKTMYGERVVHIDSGTIGALRAHRAAQVHRVLRSSSDLVFATIEGLPLNPNGISQRFERLVARAGLPPIRLHDLRHGAATIGLSAGVAMKTMSEQLGHATYAFTADRYTSVTDEVARAAAESVAAIIPRAVPAASASPAACPPRARTGTSRAVERTAANVSSQVRGGAALEIRTPDLRITSALLCQLS
jgi:integrase